MTTPSLYEQNINEAISSLQEVGTALMHKGEAELASVINDRCNDIARDLELMHPTTLNKYFELDFDVFCGENQKELDLIFAETGADRELDFDYEREARTIFEDSNQARYPQLLWHIPIELLAN